jgi:hypothetical protein
MTLNRKTILSVALVFVTLLAISGPAYTGFWFYTASRIKTAALDIRAEALKNGYQITGPPVKIGGFPGPHSIFFSGDIKSRHFHIEVPSLNVDGFLLPRHEAVISLPGGIKTLRPYDNYGLLQLKSAVMQIIIPEKIPAGLTKSHLHDWQLTGNKIEITDFDIRREDAAAAGKATLFLNPALQPELRSEITLSGHTALIDKLNKAGLIPSKYAMLLKALVTAASDKDPDSGELLFDAEINIENRKLTVGALELVRLPYVDWPEKNNTNPHLY